ncbi:uncharacterized protein ARMOST_19389 [Armillaria ostoyae]|uniref:Protein kinase domain-containing protein n=1 Tax=Armillaria ostoyae TaxID=47428 RepID=A0A284S4E9_ARMOS|nr:uncharacterized protein ARMOST_19389 [Armillaria ostoyae]
MDCHLIIELNSQEDDNMAPSINAFSAAPSIHTTAVTTNLQPASLPNLHLLFSNADSILSSTQPHHQPLATSVLFKCIVKKPNVIQLEINGEMQSNASDVTVQFLAELRVYTVVTRHWNICAFLGTLKNMGMLLEYIDRLMLYDVVTARPEWTREAKIDFHNQLLDGLTHLHPFGLIHGDLSLLNVQVTVPANAVKLLDFGRSVSADSIYKSPDDEPINPFAYLIHPSTRPFCAPEILRGECQDALLADAYSFGIILVCLDRCKKWRGHELWAQTSGVWVQHMGSWCPCTSANILLLVEIVVGTARVCGRHTGV